MGKTTGITTEGIAALERKPTMVICPVCGYDPYPPFINLSPQELWKQRTHKLFMINALQSWWLSQTEYVCRWLKERGLKPNHILDVGCGDGRWIYGIKSIFPETGYTGIDRLEDHYRLNKENFPEIDWILGDVCKYEPDVAPDTVFIMGTLNPILSIKDQTSLLSKVRELAPLNIVFLFDKNSTGREPHGWISDVYELKNTLNIENDYKSPKQDLVVWRFAWKKGPQNLEISNVPS